MAALLMASADAFSACVIHYNRTACAGQEKASYAKCDEKDTPADKKGTIKECDKTVRAESKEECAAEALKACENSRVTETKSKIITAKWGKDDLMSASGKKDFCIDFAKRSTQYDQKGCQ